MDGPNNRYMKPPFRDRKLFLIPCFYFCAEEPANLLLAPQTSSFV
jgi:hypothetical protein